MKKQNIFPISIFVISLLLVSLSYGGLPVYDIVDLGTLGDEYCCAFTINSAGQIIYVDADANGLNNGTSWADAYNYLQDALADANSSPKPIEIRVAQGTYTPDSNSVYPEGTGDRKATFQLINGVTLKGGYAGCGEPDPDARNIGLYETILSGDLDGNDIDVRNPCDLLEEPTRAENSYHVVNSSFMDETAILNGFIITAGNANAQSGSSNRPHFQGGGMFNYKSSPTITCCKFRMNSARYDGGGMCNERDGPTVTNCTFIGNSAYWGGGMSTYRSQTILTHCFFIGNCAAVGGGMDTSGGNINPILNNCIFSGNSASRNGGGIFCFISSPTFSNCTIYGNWTDGLGGGIIADDNCHPTVINSILWGNKAGSGGAQIAIHDCSMTMSYTDLEGGYEGAYIVFSTLNWGEGNIDADPCFAEPGYWADVNDINITVEPNDPNAIWVDGDYHLLPVSPCIDAGADAGVYDDIEGNIRPFDYPGVDNNGELEEFDMGAYEAVPQIEVPMKLTPQTLNCYSKSKWIKAHLVLPPEFTVEDVNSRSLAMVCPFHIEPNRVDIFVNDDNLVEIEAAFGRAYLCSILRGSWFSEVTITVRGSFTNGWYFYGMDTIRIIDNSYEQLAILSLHWLDVNCSEPDWCDGVDINQDFTVNFYDFAFMAFHWLENNNP